MMRSFPDIPDDKLRAIEAPTLVMLGDQDVILPEHAVRLAQLVTHGQLAIFPGAQHGAYLGAAEVAARAGPQLLDLGVKTLETFLADPIARLSRMAAVYRGPVKVVFAVALSSSSPWPRARTRRTSSCGRSRRRPARRSRRSTRTTAPSCGAATGCRPRREKGVLIIQHGLRDHSDNYDHLARRAAAAGFSVWAADLRGHARSAGPRVAPDPWHDYIDDFDQFIGIVRAAEPGQPIFLIGHSMGGAIVAMEVAEHEAEARGRDPVGAGAQPRRAAARRRVGAAVRRDRAGPRRDEPRSRGVLDRSGVGKAMVKDALVEQGAGPARTAAGSPMATAEIFEHIDQLHVADPRAPRHRGSADRAVGQPRADRDRAVDRQDAADLRRLRARPRPRAEGREVEDDIARAGSRATPAARGRLHGSRAAAIYAGALRGDPAGTLTALSSAAA